MAGYLNVHRIVNLAVATGCDALHPGYGFLSEDPRLAEAFARAVEVAVQEVRQAVPRRISRQLESLLAAKEAV